MKRIIVGCLVMVLTGFGAWADESEELLRKGLFEEEGNRDLEAAKKSYLQLTKDYDQRRRYAATALFRLGEIARKQGDRDEAVKWYRRVLDEFPGNKQLATVSRQNLIGLGVGEERTPGDGPEGGATPSLNPEQAELARLKELKKSSPDLIDGVDSKGWRPIHYAAVEGWLDLLNYLLEQGVTIDATTAADRWNALHLASAHGHLAVVQRLIEAGANIEAEAELERESVNMKVIPIIVSRGEWRPLHLAVLWERREIAKTLIEAKCELNVSSAMASDGGATPVLLAAVTGQKEMVDLLLAAGADLNHVDEVDPWPIVPAAIQEAPAMLPFLLKRGADPNYLNHVIDHQPEMLAEFIAAGADVNRAYRRGMTALHQVKSPKFAKLLLDAGAQIEALDLEGNSPLLVAARYGRADVVTLLLDRGANAAQRSGRGQSLLQSARKLAVPVVYEKLIYPQASRKDGVMWFNHWDVNSPESDLPHGANRGMNIVTKRGELGPPSVIDLVLHRKLEALGWFRVLRPDGKGGMLTVCEFSGAGLSQGVPDFPPLEWGDVIEVIKKFENPGGGIVDPRGWWNSLPARQVTIKAGPWMRRVRVDPKLRPWGEGPQFGRDKGVHAWGELYLSKYVARKDELIDRTSVTLLRGEKKLELDFVKDPHSIILEDGDVVELKFTKQVLEGDSTRWKGSRILGTVAGFYSVTPTPRKGDTPEMMSSLFHRLARTEDPFGSHNIFEFCDFSVLIQRPGDDGMKEIKVDVLSIANKLLPDGKAGASFSARKDDVMLEDGDLIILFPKDNVLTIGGKPEAQPAVLRTFLRAASEELKTQLAPPPGNQN